MIEGFIRVTLTWIPWKMSPVTELAGSSNQTSLSVRGFAAWLLRFTARCCHRHSSWLFPSWKRWRRRSFRPGPVNRRVPNLCWSWTNHTPSPRSKCWKLCGLRSAANLLSFQCENLSYKGHKPAPLCLVFMLYSPVFQPSRYPHPPLPYTM